jgi:hypothetical protein
MQDIWLILSDKERETIKNIGYKDFFYSCNNCSKWKVDILDPNHRKQMEEHASRCCDDGTPISWQIISEKVV